MKYLITFNGVALLWPIFIILSSLHASPGELTKCHFDVKHQHVGEFRLAYRPVPAAQRFAVSFNKTRSGTYNSQYSTMADRCNSTGKCSQFCNGLLILAGWRAIMANFLQ